jgi:hypothetical protein
MTPLRHIQATAPTRPSGQLRPLSTERNFLFLVLWASSAAFCTAMALLWIPDDPEPLGALFGSACWLMAGLLLIPCARIGSSANEALRVEHILMFALCYWLLLDLVTGEYPLEQIRPDQISIAFVAIWTFAFGIWVGVQGRGWRPPTIIRNAVRQTLPGSSLMIAIWTTFLLGMLYYAYASDFDPVVMTNGLLAGRWSAPWSAGQMGGWESFIVTTQYFGYLLPCLVVLLVHKRGWVSPSVWVAIALTVIVILFTAQSGSRRMVGIMLGAGFVCWILLQRRFTPRVLIISALNIVAVLGIFALMLTYRGDGFEKIVEKEDVQSNYGFLHVDDDFLRLAQIVDLFPEFHPYANLEPIIYAVVRPVPRVFWPGKPISAGYDMADLVGATGVSLTQSIVGELYACHGLFAVFIGGLVFGRMGSLFNNIFNEQGDTGRASVYGIGLLALFASLRSMSEIFVYFYVLFGWLGILKLLTVIRQRIRGAGSYRSRMV